MSGATRKIAWTVEGQINIGVRVPASVGLLSERVADLRVSIRGDKDQPPATAGGSDSTTQLELVL